MPTFTLRATVLLCALTANIAVAQEARFIELSSPIPDRIASKEVDERKSGFYYLSGHAEPDIRVEVQMLYHTVSPDFETCGFRSSGWHKPIHLDRFMVFRPTQPRYGALLSRDYKNSEDPKSDLCTWAETALTVRAYRKTDNDLIAVVKFEMERRAPYVTDPRPIPPSISLSCSRLAAPLHDWKPRCTYAPSGSAYTHFLLNAAHSRLVKVSAAEYMVEVPIEVNFRFND